MLARPLAVLAATAAAAALVAHQTAMPSVAAGAAVGLVCALSAVVGAALAERRSFDIRRSLAVVVVGMLARFVFVAVCAVLAIGVYALPPLLFAAALAAVYLVGQFLEVHLLLRARDQTP